MRVSQSWAEQHDAPTGCEDPAGFGQRSVRVGEHVVYLVGPVPVRLTFAQRQVGGVRAAYVDVGEPAAGGGEHGRVRVHADGVGAGFGHFGEFGDGASGAAADVDHRCPPGQPQQVVAALA